MSTENLLINDSHQFTWKDFNFNGFSQATILAHVSGTEYLAGFLSKTQVLEIDLGKASFSFFVDQAPTVAINLIDKQLTLNCTCSTHPNERLCFYQAQVLSDILKREELKVFFDADLRETYYKRTAIDYGLEEESNLSRYFTLSWNGMSAVVKPISSALIAITNDSLESFKGIFQNKNPELDKHSEKEASIIVFKQHKYYQHFCIDFYQSNLSKDGKPKNPLTSLNPLDFIWNTDEQEQVRFFTALQQFQNPVAEKKSISHLKLLKAVANNPNGYQFYQHHKQLGENVNASSISAIQLHQLKPEIKLKVVLIDAFYLVKGTLFLGPKAIPLAAMELKFDFFMALENNFYLPSNLEVLGLFQLLKKHPEGLMIHQRKFLEFKRSFLEPMEDKITIDYRYIKTATEKQLQKHGFHQEAERIIYLSDFGQHVMIIPVMRYGEAEVQVRSRVQVYGMDEKKKEFLVPRNQEEEERFTALLTRQHPYFEEQAENDLHYFYLHKKHFLNEEWFFPVFEEWHHQQITILGFNELENNSINLNKAKITIKVISGLNWFNANIKVGFGGKKASLKHLHKAIRNKHKYVKLDDGTLGIIPKEWLEKFAEYFNAGEVVDDETLQIPKVNFTAVEGLFESEMLDEKASLDLQNYRKLAYDFKAIKEVPVPLGLNTELRDYQKEGLNWLNFLDDFNFGGILADDMGLGKTIQIIAFILHQQQKVQHNVNLLVVPTSLLFNWKAEITKFAPILKIHTIYGADRAKKLEDFEDCQLVMTSYGTLLSDINYLKNYNFNYVFLDESQNIKNPESQRYKAVRLLQSRNKIAISGTPIENNTFDLYGQLSFACPGLLGSKQYFKDIYAMPIDMFKSSKRVQQLKEKVAPFILRRSKSEVASELPEKTEMVLYCEMGTEQRNSYETYEKEFREYISATTNEELKRSPMNVLKGLTRLRQLCDSPLLLKGDRLPGNASTKIEMLLSQINEHAPHHKILVFSQFVSMLDLIKIELKKQNIPFSYLTGSTKNREEVVNEFQADPEIRVFLMSMKAGGIGLNLTEADYVYLVDPWWNPAVENQAIDRSHRIGQHKNVIAIRLICPDTVEEKIMELQERKKSLFSEVVSSEDSFLKTLRKEELLQLVSPKKPIN
ncbi:MAG: DEAD/DEAH box helicase [Pelobium sp.]